jgi:putative membrane protein
MMGYGYYPMWGWIGGIFSLLFWVLVIIAIVVLVRWLKRSPHDRKICWPWSGKSALDILKERYAKGEVDKKEFEEKKKELE